MLGIRLGKDPCQFVRLLKVKGGSPGRRQIATGRGQQLDAAIRARLPIPLSFAIAPVCQQGAPLFCRRSGSPGSLQKEMLFRINRPTKMAVSDRPKAWVVLYSLVLSTCAVAY